MEKPLHGRELCTNFAVSPFRHNEWILYWLTRLLIRAVFRLPHKLLIWKHVFCECRRCKRLNSNIGQRCIHRRRRTRVARRPQMDCQTNANIQPRHLRRLPHLLIIPPTTNTITQLSTTTTCVTTCFFQFFAAFVCQYVEWLWNRKSTKRTSKLFFSTMGWANVWLPR